MYEGHASPLVLPGGPRRLYEKLRAVNMPMFYHDRARWIGIMRQAIAFNASFFNTHRMVQQYAAPPMSELRNHPSLGLQTPG